MVKFIVLSLMVLALLFVASEAQAGGYGAGFQRSFQFQQSYGQTYGGVQALQLAPSYAPTCGVVQQQVLQTYQAPMAVQFAPVQNCYGVQQQFAPVQSYGYGVQQQRVFLNRGNSFNLGVQRNIGGVHRSFSFGAGY